MRLHAHPEQDHVVRATEGAGYLASHYLTKKPGEVIQR